MKSTIKKTSILVAAAAAIMISFSAQASVFGFLFGEPYGGCCGVPTCSTCNTCNTCAVEEPVCPSCVQRTYNYCPAY